MATRTFGESNCSDGTKNRTKKFVFCSKKHKKKSFDFLFGPFLLSGWEMVGGEDPKGRRLVYFVNKKMITIISYKWGGNW